jgi:plasmid stabilization system protein ParE
LNEVGEAIERAASHPERHPIVVADVQRTVLRRFPYAIYFPRRDPLLVVLAVFHGRRDPLIWKRRA